MCKRHGERLSNKRGLKGETTRKIRNILLHLNIPKGEREHQNVQLFRFRRKRKQHGKHIVNALVLRLATVYPAIS
jgi:hypothetical protein